MSSYDINQAIQHLAEGMAEGIGDSVCEGRVAIVGIRSRGDEVAERVGELLKERGVEFDFGVLDISLYRDDLAHLHENPKLKSSEISFTIDEARVVLVDDVLFTGRTIRAAMDALTDYGRPRKIELAVLFDRGHRELPIEPNYVGEVMETDRMDRVHVKLKKTNGEDSVEVVKAAS